MIGRILFTACLAFIYACSYLNPHHSNESISEQQLERIIQSRSSEMHFRFGQEMIFSFDIGPNQARHTISITQTIFDKLGQPHGFISPRKGIYQKCIGKCLDTNLGSPQTNTDQPLINNDYYFSKPLVVDSGKPSHIDRHQLSTLLSKENNIIYSGAGLSYGVVPTMSDLQEQLGWEDPTKVDPVTAAHKMIQQMENSAEVMGRFYNSMLYGKPTKGHLAVKQLTQIDNVMLITENLDLLHQRTGIKPIGPPAPHQLRGKFNLKSIQYILCLGLSHDDRGLLAYFKELNPNIRFISIDIALPNYLGTKDFLVQEDLQEVLPYLVESKKK